MKDQNFVELKQKMNGTIETLQREFMKVRTGRASVSLLDGIKVECYGTVMPLDQTATVLAPESRILSIQPWDQSIIADIEKAIRKSELGLNPSNDGKIIRISIPALTEERRKELVKLAKKMSEDSKVTVRNHRRDANETLKESKNDKQMSEDDMHKALDQVQKLTDEYIKKIDEITTSKEKEIMEF
jgi:ribosome recycling factor